MKLLEFEVYDKININNQYIKMMAEFILDPNTIEQYEVIDFSKEINPEKARIKGVMEYTKENILRKPNDQRMHIAKNIIELLTKQNVVSPAVEDIFKKIIASEVNLNSSEIMILVAIGASPNNELPREYISQYINDTTLNAYMYKLRDAMKYIETELEIITIDGDEEYAKHLNEFNPQVFDEDTTQRLLGTIYRLDLKTDQEKVKSRVIDYENLFEKFKLLNPNILYYENFNKDFVKILNSTYKNKVMYNSYVGGLNRAFLLLGLTYFGTKNKKDNKYDYKYRKISDIRAKNREFYNVFSEFYSKIIVNSALNPINVTDLSPNNMLLRTIRSNIRRKMRLNGLSEVELKQIPFLNLS